MKPASFQLSFADAIEPRQFSGPFRIRLEVVADTPEQAALEVERLLELNRSSNWNDTGQFAGGAGQASYVLELGPVER